MLKFPHLFIVKVLTIFATLPTYKIVTGQNCDPDCVGDINELSAFVDNLYIDETNNADSYVKRVDDLGKHYAPIADVQYRIADVEYYMQQNVTEIYNRVQSEFQQLYDYIADVRSRIPGGPGPGTTDPPPGTEAKTLKELDDILTKAINAEKDSIKKLQKENDLWRQNFRHIKKAFAKLEQKKLV